MSEPAAPADVAALERENAFLRMRVQALAGRWLSDELRVRFGLKACEARMLALLVHAGGQPLRGEALKAKVLECGEAWEASASLVEVAVQRVRRALQEQAWPLSTLRWGSDGYWLTAEFRTWAQALEPAPPQAFEVAA